MDPISQTGHPSHARLTSQPPPKAGPLMAATVVLGEASIMSCRKFLWKLHPGWHRRVQLGTKPVEKHRKTQEKPRKNMEKSPGVHSQRPGIQQQISDGLNQQTCGLLRRKTRSSSNKNMPKMRTCLRNLVFKQRCRSNQRHKIPETHGVSVQMGLHMPKNVMKCKVDEGKGIGLNLDQGLLCNPIDIQGIILWGGLLLFLA